MELPADTSRHIQVLRLQPGAAITLFDGRGGEYEACILQMGRHTVAARIDRHQTLERESAVYSHIVIGMPANERMDWLVEKATELGVARITPLMTAHGVLRLNAERVVNQPCVRLEVDDQPVELVIFGVDGIRQSPVSPVDGKPMRRANLEEVEALLANG